jgi:hypothetical protein
MGFTADGGPPTKSPFTSSYVRWITGIASDVNKLMKYLPALASTQDTYPFGGGGGSDVFLARITGGDITSKYLFEEMAKIDELLVDGRTGEATNLLQVGLRLEENDMYVPPGFTGDCFTGVFPESVLSWEVKKIMPGTYVHILAKSFPPKDPRGDTQTFEYTFSAPLPICVHCDGA